MAKSLSGNYIYALINTITKFLFPIVTFPYVTRILFAEGIGLVNFYSSVIAYIVLITSIGIPSYAVRQIARVKDNFDERSKQTTEIFLLHFILTILGYVAVIVIAITVPRIHENLWLFLLISTNIFFVTIGCEWFYQGIEDFRYITIRAIAVRVVSVVLLFVFVKDRSDILYYGAYTVFGIIGSNLLNFFRLRKYISLSRIRFRDLNPLIHFYPSIQIFGLSLIASIYLNLDIVMLGFLKDDASVGYYVGAEKLTKMLMELITALGVVLLPHLSSLVAHDNLDKFKEIVTKSVQYVTAVSIPMVIGVIFLAPLLINIFCGDSYQPSVLCLIILAPIIFFISVSYILSQAFYPLDMMRPLYIRAIVSAVVNFALNMVLIPLYAHDGAAIATFFAEFSSMIISVYLFSKSVKISLFNLKYFRYIIASLIMLIALYSMSLMLHNDSIRIIILPIVGLRVYLSVLKIYGDEIIEIALSKLMQFKGNRSYK